MDEDKVGGENVDESGTDKPSEEAGTVAGEGVEAGAEEGAAGEEAATPEKVVVESADDRVLKCTVDGVVYEGQVLEVEADKAEGVRQTLLEAGFMLK